MIHRSEIKKSKHPCPVCTRRKVKCDRLVPCSNCIKRGLEKECVHSESKSLGSSRSSTSEPKLSSVLLFWQRYEYWIIDIGLSKSKRIDLSSDQMGMKDNLDGCDYWMDYLTREQSFYLLDYSMERLGALYFGCVSDVGELYFMLEEYWKRRDMEVEDNYIRELCPDDYYWNAILWAIFTLTIYFMPLEKIASVFPLGPTPQLLKRNIEHPNDTDTNTLWSETLQKALFKRFSQCSITQLYAADFIANPDVRLVQVYLILSNTMSPQEDVYLSDGLLMQCFHLAKVFHVNDFKPLIDDTTALRLTKLTCEKLWYRLCICDYLQAGPNKPIDFHTELPSLLQHAAYLEDLPNVDVHQSEDNFEVLYWKIISLDRDLDQYLLKETKPPLKTLDAVERQIEIFNSKISSSEENESLNSDFEKFLAAYLLRTISWKLYKMYFIYYSTSNALAKTLTYAKCLITLLVKNIKKQKNVIFNKHPIILRSFARVSSFYAFYGMFSKSAEIQNLNLDIAELLSNLSMVFDSELISLKYLLTRFNSLKVIWANVRLIDTEDSFRHPVIRILQNDIDEISQHYEKRPSLIKGMGVLISRKRKLDDNEDNEKQSSSLNSIVSEFESQYSIDRIVK